MNAMKPNASSGYNGWTCSRTSIAMIVHHLAEVHGMDEEEIANAPIVDFTDPRDVDA